MNNIKCNCTAFLESGEVPPERHDRTCPVYQAHAYIGIDIDTRGGESKTRIYINGKTFVPIEELEAVKAERDEYKIQRDTWVNAEDLVAVVRQSRKRIVSVACRYKYELEKTVALLWTSTTNLMRERDLLKAQAAQDETEVDGYAAVMKERDELKKDSETLRAQLQDAARSAGQWKTEYEMFKGAWVRETNGVLRKNKTHLIDELVLLTRSLREKADKWDAALKVKP